MHPTSSLAAKAAEHGRLLYVYNNIATNQTVYSLYRSMNNNDILKQITFVGKKTKPAKLRKDMWRPLVTVTFPSGKQGLAAYRKLREYRKIRETTWDPADVPALGERKEKGIKGQPTREERSRFLMDQKANSIADLAAVLQLQVKKGKEYDLLRQKEAETEEAKRDEELELVRKADRGEIDVYLQRIKEKEESLVSASAPGQKERLEKELLELRREKNRMKKAQEAAGVKEAEQKAAAPSTQAQGDAVQTVSIASKANQSSLKKRVKKEQPLPKYGVRRKELLDPGIPVVTMEGLRIQWTNPLDAEYAATWPEGITHEVMGLHRHTAPDPEGPPRSVAYLVQKMTGEAIEEVEEGELATEEGKEGEDAQQEGEAVQKEGEVSLKEGEGGQKEVEPEAVVPKRKGLASWFSRRKEDRGDDKKEL